MPGISNVYCDHVTYNELKNEQGIIQSWIRGTTTGVSSKS